MILNFERKNTDFKILWDHKNSISYTNNEKVKNEVKKQFGVDLHTEVRIIGEE